MITAIDVELILRTRNSAAFKAGCEAATILFRSYQLTALLEGSKVAWAVAAPEARAAYHSAVERACEQSPLQFLDETYLKIVFLASDLLECWERSSPALLHANRSDKQVDVVVGAGVELEHVARDMAETATMTRLPVFGLFSGKIISALPDHHARSTYLRMRDELGLT